MSRIYISKLPKCTSGSVPVPLALPFCYTLLSILSAYLCLFLNTSFSFSIPLPSLAVFLFLHTRRVIIIILYFIIIGMRWGWVFASGWNIYLLFFSLYNVYKERRGVSTYIRVSAVPSRNIYDVFIFVIYVTVYSQLRDFFILYFLIYYSKNENAARRGERGR